MKTLVIRVQNVVMKKVLVLFLTPLFIFNIFFSLTSCAAFCETNTEVSQTSKMETGEAEEEEEHMFAPIDLKLEESEKPKNVKRFKLRAEVEEKPKVNKYLLKTWDDSKSYRYQYFGDQRNLRPIAALASQSSYMVVPLDEQTSVYTGQRSLSSYDGIRMSFIRKRESDYDVGTKVIGSFDKLDYSVGVYTDTNTLSNSFGGILSTKPRKIRNSKGDFSFGAGLYSNDFEDYSRNTAGFFTKYRQGKFTVSGQLAQSNFSSNREPVNSVHFQADYKVNDYITLTSRIIKELNTEYALDEYAVRVFPFGSKKDTVDFELSARNVYSAQDVVQQRFKFVTNIRF